jgi:predicted esterase
MRSIMSRVLIVIISVVAAQASARSFAPMGDSYMFVRTDWHLAGIAEAHADWRGAISYYEKVIEESAPLNIYVREWYRGTAGYGIARCSAQLGDRARIKRAMTYAFEHHFWNFKLVHLDSAVMAACGNQWVDSAANFWGAVAQEESERWHEQKPITYYPKGYDSTARWPLIVALHGGNGNFENFAEYWNGIADAVGAVIVVPPGVIRESEVTNTWESKMDRIEGPITDLVRNFTQKKLADPKEVYLTGFSQGAQASIELTLLHPEIFRGAISMSGFSSKVFTDSALEAARQKDVHLFAITGEMEDEAFRSQIEQARDRCVAKSIPFQLKIIPGMTHEVPLDLRTQFLLAWNFVHPVSEASHAKSE